jgi:hypothetical protein
VDSAKELGLDVESLTEISVEGEKKQELSEVAINPSTKTIN